MSCEIWPGRFRYPGNPEYVLAKAGFYKVLDCPDGWSIEPSELLARLFHNAPIPPPDKLVPVLIDIVFVCSHELAGALNMWNDRVRLVGELLDLGMTQWMGSIGEVFKLIGEATTEAAVDYRNVPKGHYAVM